MRLCLYDLLRNVHGQRPLIQVVSHREKQRYRSEEVMLLAAQILGRSFKLAISLGGDSDTIACITGAVSHAYYGSIPKRMIESCRNVMDTN